jgi:hypothetical protein
VVNGLAGGGGSLQIACTTGLSCAENIQVR